MNVRQSWSRRNSSSSAASSSALSSSIDGPPMAGARGLVVAGVVELLELLDHRRARRCRSRARRAAALDHDLATQRAASMTTPVASRNPSRSAALAAGYDIDEM
jgi:hypothetical protein